MNRPFNMPDEFVEGFMKAGASLWRSLGWTPNADRDGTGPAQLWVRRDASPNYRLTI